MHIRATFLTSVAFAVSLAASVSAQEPTANTVVTTVNGVDITLGELIIARAQLPEQFQGLPPEVLFDGIVEQLVQQQLLSEILEVEPDRLILALANERRSLRAGEVITNLTKAAISDEALQAAYDARFEDLEPEIEYRAAHILVDSEEEAIAVNVLLDDGANFAETAQEISTGPSGPSGGELGWFSAGMMVPEFDAVVQNLEAGGVSDPVQTQFGWHVVTLYETRLKAAPSLEEMRAELEAGLIQSAIEGRLAELTDAAEIVRNEEIEFDPALLTNLDLLLD